MAITFTASDLPHPDMPIMRMPFGRGSPFALASAVNSVLRWRTHVLSWSRPPMSAMARSGGTNSRIPSLRITCSFSASTSVMKSAPRFRWRASRRRSRCSTSSQRHAAQRPDEHLQRGGVGRALGLLEHRGDRRCDLPLVGEQRCHDVGERFELVGKLDLGGEDEDEAAGVADRRRGVAQGAKELAIARQERVQVLEDVEPVLALARELAQRRDRIRVGVAADEPIETVPHRHRQRLGLGAGGETLQEPLDAVLLRRQDDDERVGAGERRGDLFDGRGHAAIVVTRRGAGCRRGSPGASSRPRQRAATTSWITL